MLFSFNTSKDISVLEREDVTIDISSFVPADWYFLYRDGLKLDSTSSNSFKLTNIQPEQTGSYEIRARNNFFIEADEFLVSDSFKIIVTKFPVNNEEKDLLLISPNGDGINDIVSVLGYGIESVNFKIYNRWGQLVFESNDRYKGWDGTFKGEPQEMDVYGYLLDVTFFDGSKKFKKGNITLLR